MTHLAKLVRWLRCRSNLDGGGTRVGRSNPQSVSAYRPSENREPAVRVGYVVVREDLSSPIIRSQVLDVLKVITSSSDIAIDLIWFCRADLLSGGRRLLHEIRNELSPSVVRIHIWPIIGSRFPPSWWELIPILPQLCLGLVVALVRFRLKIVHCRGYTGSVACALLRPILRSALIFDPRSPMPEERAAQGRWTPGSFSFRVWKNLERFVLGRADITIATSPAFGRHLVASLSAARIRVIPNNYPLSFGSQVTRAPSREDDTLPGSVLPGSALRLCYVGTFGHWNSIDAYASFLVCLRSTGAIVDVLFVTPEAAKNQVDVGLREALDEEGITWQVISLAQDEIGEIVSPYLAGMQLMDLEDPRLSIKVVEYLASGLPVLVSENVRGAAELVAEHGVGFILAKDLSNIAECREFLQKVATDRIAWSERCRKLAYAQFSPETVAAEIASVYRSL